MSSKAAGEVARGELGWLSLKARRELKQLIYWGKVLKMDEFGKKGLPSVQKNYRLDER